MNVPKPRLLLLSRISAQAKARSATRSSAGLVGERIYAVDLSERSLEVAASLSDKVVAIVSDVAHVEALGDASVDAVTSSQVIEHLPDDRALAAEIARISAPGGWFYVSSVVRGPHAWWFRRGGLGWQIDPTHVREYESESAFAAALVHPRLEVERVRSRPLRFPIADPALRVASGVGLVRADRLATAYERSAALTRRAVRCNYACPATAGSKPSAIAAGAMAPRRPTPNSPHPGGVSSTRLPRDRRYRGKTSRLCPIRSDCAPSRARIRRPRRRAKGRTPTESRLG